MVKREIRFSGEFAKKVVVAGVYCVQEDSYLRNMLKKQYV